MTIRDLNESGIELQGRYIVKEIIGNDTIDISEKYDRSMNMEIKYIYCENGHLIIEVEEE